ncbi:MAG TPA: vWA domain-containing protein [Polyangiaceae bacterium]|nr:vWA domain-containing protein [Polyangiaceae bacterium]
MKTTAFLCCISSLALSLACGSTKEDSSHVADTPSTAGMFGTGGSGSLDVGSGGSGALPGSGDKMGGILTLTPDQVAAINNNACEGWSAEPESKPAVLEFVVDTSLSMNEVPGASTQPGQGRPGMSAASGPTKWQSTRDALKAVIQTLPDTIAAGLLFYPNMANQARSQPASADTCVNTRAGIAPALLTAAQKANLVAALDATNPNGWTPTDAAYQFALQNSLIPSQIPGDKYVLLITDGQPTLRGDCTSAGNGQGAGITPVESQPIIDHVAAALGKGVRTFLIGSPGSEGGRAWMSEAAIVGGTAAAGCKVMGPPYCHLDMTTSSDFGVALKAGLNKVTGSIACTYDIPDPGQGQVIDHNLINLVVTTASGKELVLPDDGADCTEGWRISGNQVVLCEGTCSRVQRDHDSIQLLFGCQSGMIGVPK